METLLNRYRNITILLLAIFAQLILLAYQVKNTNDVPMIRVWAVSAVTPLAKALEVARSSAVGVVQGYITLHDTHEENQRMKQELGRLKMENQFLKTELSTADRAKALIAFQAQTQSKTLAARVIGQGAGFNSQVVFVDRGSAAGVEKGMAVVTPDGIVGKVLGAYPTASQVLLITDPNFAAGVISQKHHVHGTLKGTGHAECKVEYVQNEEKLDVGEWFYTSGDDRIFPKGFPAGVVRVVRNGQGMKEIYVEPSGVQHGLEEVLILLEGVHQAIPDAPVAANEPVYMAPPPPAAPGSGAQDEANRNPAETDADRLRERYKELGAAQNHVFGEGLPGSKPPDFNLRLPAAGGAPAGTAPAAGVSPAVKPAPPAGGTPQTRGTATTPAAPGATLAPPARPSPSASAPRSTGQTATSPAAPRPEPAPASKKPAAAPGAATAPARPSPSPSAPSSSGRTVTTPAAPRPEPAPAPKKPAAPPAGQPQPSKPIDSFL